MISKAITDDMDAREIESLSMLSRGFEELREVNPELAYSVILDILAGLNEYVIHPSRFTACSQAQAEIKACASIYRPRAGSSRTSVSHARAR